jgi:hypothetical protein
VNLLNLVIVHNQVPIREVEDREHTQPIYVKHGHTIPKTQDDKDDVQVLRKSNLKLKRVFFSSFLSINRVDDNK